ncbi:MAG: hypothetical protein R2795_12580 [Saprospiraceae bacterium]
MGGYFVLQKYWPVAYRIDKMAYYLLLSLGIWGVSIILSPLLPNHIAWRLLLNTFLLIITLGLLYKTEWPWLRKVLRG